uniref:Uncharacterized protein isoform X2 n=1 Tax=Pogona vitticeps TaxID=103695 RepID=A0ABM5END3_9SAUR
MFSQDQPSLLLFLKILLQNKQLRDQLSKTHCTVSTIYDPLETSEHLLCAETSTAEELLPTMKGSQDSSAVARSSLKLKTDAQKYLCVHFSAPKSPPLSQGSPQFSSKGPASPRLDACTVLLVQLYGLDAVYIPDPIRQRPGKVAPPAGQALELNAQSQRGWRALPLFDRSYVRSGVHCAPLFQGVPTAEFLQRLAAHLVKDVPAGGLKSKRLQLLKGAYASLAVEIWDGRYFDDE